MKELPLALQAELLESERRFTQLLQRLGLTRQDLDQVATRIRRDHGANLFPKNQQGRRVNHVHHTH